MIIRFSKGISFRESALSLSQDLLWTRKENEQDDTVNIIG